jgi:hypothetical protein
VLPVFPDEVFPGDEEHDDEPRPENLHGSEPAR